MESQNLVDIINYIINKSSGLKNKFTTEFKAPVEFACVFCQNEGEYRQLSRVIERMGKVVQDTQSGYTYQLYQPMPTAAGPLRLIKIRKPDPIRPERGDADFNTDYTDFRKIYQGRRGFELIKREKFEMLRLSSPDSNVLACFSNIPLGQQLGLKD